MYLVSVGSELALVEDTSDGHSTLWRVTLPAGQVVDVIPGQLSGSSVVYAVTTVVTDGVYSSLTVTTLSAESGAETTTATASTSGRLDSVGVCFAADGYARSYIVVLFPVFGFDEETCVTPESDG